MTDCLFCRIVAGEIDARIVEEGEAYVAFADIAPQAPTHVLVVPRAHVARLSEHADQASLGATVAAAARIGRARGGEDGFRLVVNEGPDAGQSVDHVHLHVLAGRSLAWPPG